MKIAITELKDKLFSAAKTYISTVEAEYFSELVVDTYLKKYPRSNPLKSAIKDVQTWKDARADITRKVDKSALTIYDFHGKAPALKVKLIHDELVDKAKKNGVAVAGVVNSAGFHTLTFWTDALITKDILSICFVNGGPSAVVPYGAKGGIHQAVFGTNPMSYAIPAGKKIISADMATSEVPFFEVVNASKSGKKLIDTAMVAEDGSTTGDVRESILEGERTNISPLGANHKGSALVLLAEVLTSSLLGSPHSREMDPDRFVPEEHGNIIIAFDISSFTDAGDFQHSTEKLASLISALEPIDGNDVVQYPGAGAHKRKTERLAEGEVEVDGELLAKLHELIKK